MTTQKITLAVFTLLIACMLQACNGSHDKSGMETQSGQPGPQSSTSGNDTSHADNNRKNEMSGVDPQPAEGDAKSANGTTTAQGMMGSDSVYQKSTQKSQK